MKTVKEVIISLFGGRQSKIVKFCYALKYSFKKFKVIKKVNTNFGLKFFTKIVSGQYFVEFQTDTSEEIKYFNKKYSFSYDDWFSKNFNIWKKTLANLNEIRYLEIGSFEGRSAVFVGELKNTKEITCVDTFEGSDEHNMIDFNLVYKNCSTNLNKFNVKSNLIKDKSDNFFSKNNQKFNVIYIDGSHFYEDVKKDFINSLNCIEKGGILICDDFLWFYYNNLAHNPIVAIIECYEKFKNDLEILFINHQIIFKKIN